MSMLEHPAITRAERTGYPDGREDTEPKCPICGKEAYNFYRNRDREIVGCDECLEIVYPWED